MIALVKLSSPGIMALYIRGQRLDEERIGRGMPSEALDSSG